jgi:hypothetical protein
VSASSNQLTLASQTPSSRLPARPVLLANSVQLQQPSRLSTALRVLSSYCQGSSRVLPARPAGLPRARATRSASRARRAAHLVRSMPAAVPSVARDGLHARAGNRCARTAPWVAMRVSAGIRWAFSVPVTESLLLSADEFGLQDCLDCPAGAYCNTTGLASPVLCPGGLFQSASRQTVCLPCKPGFYASGTGSLACTPCE